MRTMCSSGNCNIGELISGPVGNIVGIGIKALVNGAPIGPKTAEAMKRPTETEKIHQFYDNIEAHMKGALQLLPPALEIKKILSGESKSTDRERPANNSQLSLQYYSPQNQRKFRESVSQARCCCKQSMSRAFTDKSKISPHSLKKEKITEKSTLQLKPNSTIKRDNNDPKKRSSSDSSYRSCSSTDKEKNSNPSTKVSKSKLSPKSCCKCDVSLKDNIVLALLPCEHTFCYTCLSAGNGKRCRKCDKTYDMKKVSQIFY